MKPQRDHFIPQIVVRVFAVVGLIATLLAVVCMISLASLGYTAPSEPDSVILSLNLDQPIVEQREETPIDLAIRESALSMIDILRALDRAARDPHVKGLITHFGSYQPSLAQSEEIRAAIARFRAKGKFTYAFGVNYGDFGSGSRAYYLASGFENIWLQPVGSVSLTGVAVQAPFVKSAMGRYGVQADFLRREEYKSVMETFTRDDFSPPVRANMQSMIDDMADQVANGVAEDRKWKVEHVKELMARGPYTASEALKLGLVTHIGSFDELKEEMKKKAGDDSERVDAEKYVEFDDDNKPESKARVALIYGTGLISDHADGPADMTGEDVMGADEVSHAFDAAADDKDIKAILFRIDSPGGSPEASETIRAALVHAQKSGKPVFVSMSSVAGSGGYWIAMSADNITAQPGTITGSIGVVAGKFVVGGLMDKYGVTTDTLKTGESNADMWSMVKEFTPEQRDRMNALLDETYHTFIQNVSAGRKIPIAKMPDIAKGRIYTGAQALKVGLVDQLGGYDVALGALRKKLDLAPNDGLALEQFPPPLSPVDKVFKILKGFGIESSMLRIALGQWQGLRTTLGPVLGDLDAGLKPVQARVPSSVAHIGQ